MSLIFFNISVCEIVDQDHILQMIISLHLPVFHFQSPGTCTDKSYTVALMLCLFLDKSV